jgi:thiamine-phosphate diphosphorylase
VSVRSKAEAAAARDAGADYLGANGVFPSKTKTDLPGPLGIEGIHDLRSITQLPLIAIGGINEANARKITEAGADGVALISALIKAEDVVATYRKILEEVNHGLERRHRTEISMRGEMNKKLH